MRSAVAEASDIRILAECKDTERLKDAVRDHAPDVLLVSADLFREGQEEFDALEELIAECVATRVIVVTSRRDAGFLERALRCGAKGVFQKEWPVHEIPMAIRKVTNGGMWLEQTAAEKVLEQALSRRMAPDTEETKIASLTPREREVIDLICQGLRNKEICQRLHISLPTVSHHLTSIFRKLEVGDRTALVVYSARRRLVSFDQDI